MNSNQNTRPAKKRTSRAKNTSEPMKSDKSDEEVPAKKLNSSSGNVLFNRDGKLTGSSLHLLDGNISDLISRIQSTVRNPVVSDVDYSSGDSVDIDSTRSASRILQKSPSERENRLERNQTVSTDEIAFNDDLSRIDKRQEEEGQIVLGNDTTNNSIISQPAAIPSVESGSTNNELINSIPSNDLNNTDPVTCKLSPSYIDMSATAASVEMDSGTIYSYKKVLEEKRDVHSEPSENKYLVVRENMLSGSILDLDDVLPEHISELLNSMKQRFDAFFIEMENAKATFVDTENKSESVSHHFRQAAGDITNLVNDVKKFPALVELELAIFAKKCRELYSSLCQEIVDENKKCRWCAFCHNLAIFHCCFKASYCSVKCQRHDWTNHSTNCGQEVHTLLDPHLRLNQILARRVLTLNKEAITISKLEELSQKSGPGSGYERKKLSSRFRQNSTTMSDNLDCSSENKRKLNFTFMKNKNLKNLIKKASVQNPKRLATNSVRGVIQKSQTYEDSSFEFVELNPEESNDSSEELTLKLDPVDLKKDSTHHQQISEDSLPPQNNLSPKKLDSIIKGEAVHNSSSPHIVASLPNYMSSSTSLTIPQIASPPIPLISEASVKYTPSVSVLNFRPNVNDYKTEPSTSSLKTYNGPGSNLKQSSDLNSQPISIKLKSVTLPNGETKLVHVDSGNNLKPNNKNAFNAHLKVNVSQPSPIAVQRSMVTSTNMFLPISQLINTQPFQPTNTVTTHNRHQLSFVPSLQPSFSTSQSPQLPALTPIMPKRDATAVRTLNDEELDKILNADHLLNAFDSSYYANVRILP